jgi:hypothetical protein
LRVAQHANVASGRYVSPSEALTLDNSLNRLADQNRALQTQLATDREVMTRALAQQERDQAVQASLIKEAKRQDQRANLLASTLDDVLRTFTDASPEAWYGKQLRSWYVKEQQLDDWRALLPASKNRSGWRTDLMSRSQYDREVQKARDNADYAQKRSNHLVSVGDQHAMELRLRAAAEQKLRDVTAERDQFAVRLSDVQPERERTANALSGANRRAQAAWEECERAERRAESTIAEARRQKARADAAEARAGAAETAAAKAATQIADLTRELADTKRRGSLTSVSLAEYLFQMGQARRVIAELESALQEARSQPATGQPLGKYWPYSEIRTAGALRSTPHPGDRVQVTYQAELVTEVDVWGRRRVRWTDDGQQTPGYVRAGSLPTHATVTALDGPQNTSGRCPCGHPELAHYIDGTGGILTPSCGICDDQGRPYSGRHTHPVVTQDSRQ